jgi:hypothetical protein
MSQYGSSAEPSGDAFLPYLLVPVQRGHCSEASSANWVPRHEREVRTRGVDDPRRGETGVSGGGRGAGQCIWTIFLESVILASLVRAPRARRHPQTYPQPRITAMSSADAAPRAAVSSSSARAEASRKNGARSRGPRTPEGKARSAQNALRHGMRAEKHVVLPGEDDGEFAGLEAALFAELAPVGALQALLARRIAVAAWRIARADQIEAELFEEHHHPGGGRGLALIRDGNGPRSFETLLRYRGAALAEFWRALRTLKALQAEQALETAPAPEAHPLAARPPRPAPRSPLVQRPQPDEPERGAGPRPECPARASRPWLPSEPETGARLACGVAAHPTACRTNPIRSAFEDLTEPNPHDPTGPEVILSYEP